MFNIVCKITTASNNNANSIILFICYFFLFAILFIVWYIFKEYVSIREFKKEESKQAENAESNKNLD